MIDDSNLNYYPVVVNTAAVSMSSDLGDLGIPPPVRILSRFNSPHTKPFSSNPVDQHELSLDLYCGIIHHWKSMY